MKAVIWDFDGTIGDTYPAIAGAVNAALGTFGVTARLERIIELASVSLDDCIRTLATEHKLPYDEFNTAFLSHYQAIQLEAQPCFPDVATMCEQLAQAGVTQFLVTHRRRASLMPLLTAYGLLPYFTEIIAGEDGFPKKPSPDSFRYLLDTYGIAPADAFVIGDRDIDIRAGQAAGIPTCLFRSTFADLSPTHTITAYHELAAIITQCRDSA